MDRILVILVGGLLGAAGRRRRGFGGGQPSRAMELRFRAPCQLGFLPFHHANATLHR